MDAPQRAAAAGLRRGRRLLGPHWEAARLRGRQASLPLRPPPIRSPVPWRPPSIALPPALLSSLGKPSSVATKPCRVAILRIYGSPPGMPASPLLWTTVCTNIYDLSMEPSRFRATMGSARRGPHNCCDLCGPFSVAGFHDGALTCLSIDPDGQTKSRSDSSRGQAWPPH